MKQTQVTFNLKGLEELRKEVGTAYETRVGILGDKAARKEGDSTLNNAEIGAIQMFGSLDKRIPPRDFLLMPIRENQRELINAMSSPAAKKAFEKKDFKRVFALLGVKAEEFIQMAFETAGFGKWPANAPLTIKIKGSSRPLIDSGQLRRAITSQVVEKQSQAVKSST